MAYSRTSAQKNGPRAQSVFRNSVKRFNHGPRAFNGGVRHRLAMQTFTMLTSFWEMVSDVELRRIFDVRKRWANSGFAWICREKYGSIHEVTRAIRSLLVWNAGNVFQHFLFNSFCNIWVDKDPGINFFYL